MICRDCKKFNTNQRMEAGKELSPGWKELKGSCKVDNKNCSSSDNCGCGQFEKK